MGDATPHTESSTREPIDQKDMSDFKNIVKKLKLMDLLVKTLGNDNENLYQDANRIEHIYESIKFIKLESISVYSLLLKTFFFKKPAGDNTSNNEIDPEHLIILLDYIRSSFKEEDFTESDTTNSDKLSLRIVELAYDLYINFATENKLTMDQKKNILTLNKDIIYKYKGFNIDLTARLTKILSLIAVKERDSNLLEGKLVIQVVKKKKLHCGY